MQTQQDEHVTPPKMTSPPVNIHVYQDSNGKRSNPGNVEAEVKRLMQQKKGSSFDFQIHYHNSYHLPGTLYQVHQRDHSNSIVIINVGTNDVRYRLDPSTHDHPLSKKDPHQMMDKIISHLKKETAPENIIILESIPSTKMDMKPYNDENYKLSKMRNIRYAFTLVRESHIWKGDKYHIHNAFRHVVSKSVAAAIMNVHPVQAYRFQMPFSPNTQH